MIKLFDTHAHYDHELFKGEGTKILKELLDEGIIDGAVIPAISFESNFNRYMFPKDEFPGVYFAAGYHPKRALSDAFFDDKMKSQLAELVRDERTVAVKTGLDYSMKKITDQQKLHQQRFFRYLIELANESGLPMVLHIRDAAEDAAEILSENRPKNGAVAHCFTYGFETAKSLMNVGVTHFGIGGKATNTENEQLRECIKRLPREALLLETDAPVVRPKGYTGGVVTSRTLIDTAELIAYLRGEALGETARYLQKNAYEFYRIKST